MAVLIQELLPANYAFVLHSKNPFNKDSIDEMYGELVPGLGEVLVGNAPGRALSWTMKKGGEPVVSYTCASAICSFLVVTNDVVKEIVFIVSK